LFAEAIEAAVSALGMEVVGLEATAEGGLAAVERLDPDLVLLDIGLPDRNGIEVGRQIVATHPRIKVVVLTALEDPSTAREAIRAGFAGYITKGVRTEQFARAVRGLTAGQIVVHTGMGDGSGRATSSSDHLTRLTARELEVLQLLAEGTPSGAIAQRMGVSPNTVRTHVQGILTKLQVHSRLEAVAYATANGIVSEAS
jgi:two-component system, NarL family, nitrate/nitrite response regulator NarL